jgi:hypothetical protein
MRAPIYVETLVRSSGDEGLWDATQDAAAHSRWDLRFSRIIDVTPQTPDAARTFRYELRLPGCTIAGTGTSLGERRRADGTGTSALRFASSDRRSLIRRGSGWWRYVPSAGGTRFLTGYDYEPGWGRVGRGVDRLVFRRLLRWATAWSFDRLRLWRDEGISPERALRRALADAALRGAGAAAALLGVRRRRPLLCLGAVVLLAPPLPGAPRAGRCLRRPPDLLGRTPPRSLARLDRP